MMRVVDVDAGNFSLLPGGCRDCAYWHGCDGEDKAMVRQRMFAGGRLQGKLALDCDGVVMGFIQYGSLDCYREFARLRQGFNTDVCPDSLVITCLATQKPFRGRGVAKALVAAVLAEGRSAGHSVEAAGMEEADFEHISVGPAELYRKMGFREIARYRDKYGVNVLLRS